MKHRANQITILLTFFLALIGCENKKSSTQSEHTQVHKKLKIGWTAWSDAEAVSQVIKQLIESKFGYEIEMVMADIGIQYQAVSQGDLDLMLMAWLPKTHSDYWQRYHKKLEDLGPIYRGGRLGWVIPDYIDKNLVNSIEDLNKEEVRSKFKAQIQGIDPGAGLMRLSEKALTEYKLEGFKLNAASGAAMTAALNKAAKQEEWIAVTGWSPHWKFAKWPLRYLEDPKEVFGGEEKIHALARKGFQNDHPEIAVFLKNFEISLSDLEKIMLRGSESNYQSSAAQYIKDNPDAIKSWLKNIKTASKS